MAKLREKLWIWGQDIGSHHKVSNNVWNLPGENKMSPVEGCRYLGIPNCCRVVMSGKPEPPFDGEAEKLDVLDKVVWSLIGDGGSRRNNDTTDLEEIIRIAGNHPNIVGAIMDDFMNPTRMKIFTPEVLASIRRRLHTAIPGRHFDLWTVIYTHELIEEARDYLAQIDRVSLWTWHSARDLGKLADNLAKLRGLTGPDKPILIGCYLWDYGVGAPVPGELLAAQLESCHKWLRSGEIDGIIFCSNTVADLGLESAEYVRGWIAEFGDEEI